MTNDPFLRWIGVEDRVLIIQVGYELDDHANHSLIIIVPKQVEKRAFAFFSTCFGRNGATIEEVLDTCNRTV